ncbi:PREDICTED: uncharacterized protein LOC109239997 [Nicotiana attenuata]|uniref:DEAD/DEAH-box helicase domain-containing protein n=1 Tax=Nicotiana attenuata TaxID=49451 RepID=A0A314L8Y2_NICAT|nr:PREDICTED: uncharacterized protein LOC109239997 [Nicotiana attenuata]OIT38022.1 hypothetical protein A4A49_38763 [Nicotiana attenuata]
MGKSDDSIQRRKNKKTRKKQDDNKLSARISGIIAAKKRRLSGKRRMCEGMCYSLPTPEDPFNERHGKPDFVKKKKKQINSKKDKNRVNKTRVALKTGATDRNNAKATAANKISQNADKLEEELRTAAAGGRDAFDNHMDAPTKFLILCLKNIQDGLQQDGTFNDGEDKPFFVHTWGIEFWKYFTRGKDIIGTNQAHATVEQIAWVAATAADAISSKEKEGISISSPFLLFLVPSQEKAAKVRKICKPLKALGIHTVSLHPGASIDHQIQGLKNCEPEFLISTPERLQELLSCGAIDTSDVSFLVIDGPLNEAGYVDAVEAIAKSISGKPQILAFSDCSDSSSNFLIKKSFGASICRIPHDDPINGQSMALDICASKLSKANGACSPDS